MNLSIMVRSVMVLLLVASVGWSQDVNQESSQQAGQELSEKLKAQVQEAGDTLKEGVKDVSKTLNESEKIQEISTGILAPIYDFADYLSFPAFYWIAFALMVAGVVSYAFQLVIGKFFLLFKFSFNIQEILSDLLGLLISAVGLVLTTQAATQNSSFPQDATAVISSTIVGAVLGLVFFWWGQSLEHKAVKKTGKHDND